MATAKGSRGSGPGRQFPVLRWLHVGAASAGLGVALIASPAAGADTGTGADSVPGGSHSASAGAASSPSSSRGVGAPRRGGSRIAARPGSGQIGSSPRSARAAGPEIASGTPLQAVAGAANSTKVAHSAAGRPSGGQSAPVPAPASSSAGGATSISPGAVGSAPTSVSAAMSGAGTYTATVTPVALTSSVASTVRASAVGGRDYPAPVTAPVTLRAILTEGLSWIGLGGLGDELPIHDAPLPDLLAGIWVGARKAHFNLFNTAPTVHPSAPVIDPVTSLITGNLGAYDADGDAINFRLTTAPAEGSVVIADDGTWTYAPNPDCGCGADTDTFTVIAYDKWAHFTPLAGLVAGIRRLLSALGLPTPARPTSIATINLAEVPVVCPAAATSGPTGGPTTATATATCTT